MKGQIGTFIICVLLAVAIERVYSTFFSPVTIDNKEVETLQARNDSLLNCVQESEIKAGILLHKIDSLKEKKTKIIIKYEIIYKNVDSANLDADIADFERIFAAEGSDLEWRHGDMLYY